MGEQGDHGRGARRRPRSQRQGAGGQGLHGGGQNDLRFRRSPARGELETGGRCRRTRSTNAEHERLPPSPLPLADSVSNSPLTLCPNASARASEILLCANILSLGSWLRIRVRNETDALLPRLKTQRLQ